MLVTFIALPYYWIRSFFIKKTGDELKIHKEMKTYPRDFFGIRGKKVKRIQVGQKMDETCIYVSNHQSMNDIFIAIDSVEEPFRFVAKKELFTNFVTGPFMKMTYSYPLDRDDPRQSLMMLKQVLVDIEAGHSVFAFPEGTRSRQAEMIEFKDGIFAMLRKAKVPMIPLYIKDSFDKKQKIYEVYYGEPVMPDTYNKMKGAELSAYMKARMNELKDIAYA